MTKFEEGSYYVMSPPGETWGDYEGPFDSKDEALDHIRLFVNEKYSHSPEMLGMVVVHFENDKLNLVSDADEILNGEYLLRRLK